MIDRKESEIESLCLRMLLTRQPVAHDLRVVSSALKMITDMERIADHAADISEIVTMIDYKIEKQPEHFLAMSRTAIDMVHRAVDAYVRQDVDLARVVIEDDDIVDDLFVEVKQEIVELYGQGFVPQHRGHGFPDDREILRTNRRPRDQYRRVGGILCDRPV